MNKKQTVFMWIGLIVFSPYAINLSEEGIILSIILVTVGFVYTFRNKKKTADEIQKPINLRRGFRRLTLFLNNRGRLPII